MEPGYVVRVVEAALKQQGISARAASLQAGSPYIIRDLRRGHVPSIHRMNRLCEVLGLDFYIGPVQKGGPAKTTDISPTPVQPKADLSRIEDAARALNREIAVAGYDPIPDELQRPVVSAPDEGDGRHVDVVELAAAAGDGSEGIGESVTGRLWFRRDWLDRQGLDSTQCAVIGVRGDSMYPTLPDGCSILVDRAARRRRLGWIYVLRLEHGLVVKRAGRSGRAWVLVSDNPQWDDAAWPGDVDVIGRVRWMAQTL